MPLLTPEQNGRHYTRREGYLRTYESVIEDEDYYTFGISPNHAKQLDATFYSMERDEVINLIADMTNWLLEGSHETTV